MGRELQKRKRRSGVAKVRQNPKSKKQIFGNAFIASQWDSTQTLSQNYQRLGLSSRLNKQTGGIEKASQTNTSTSTATKGDSSEKPADTGRRSDHDRLAINPSGQAGSATTKRKSRAAAPPTEQQPGALQEVRIERDPETGRILRVLDGGDSDPTSSLKNSNSLTAAQRTAATRFTAPGDEEDDDEIDRGDGEADEFRGFDTVHAAQGYIGSAVSRPDDGAGGEAVRSLARDAQQAAQGPAQKRKQSEREREWCARLVAAHGRSDFAAMARDARLNVMQQSVGDVKRRVTKYLQSLAGGED